MRILLLNTYDQGGGAEKVAFDLHRAYRDLGHDARLLVRHRKTNAAGVIESDPYAHTSFWAVVCAALDRFIAGVPRFRGQYRLRDWLRRTAWPQRWLDRWRGIEDFNYPYSHHLVDGPGWHPDVIHAHNLHGDYFDMRALTFLSHQIPVVWTLHDTWAFTGHCGYFIDCERWRTGCGNCPDLRRYPAIRRDRTAENWNRKRQIYASSRLAVAPPSRWLMGCVERSMLQPWRKRVIPNGVDLAIYKPGDQIQARNALGLPRNAFICMFAAASGNAKNPYKDYATVDQAVRLVVEKMPSADLLFVCVGQSNQVASDPRFRYTGYIADPYRVALYYQAADVLLHATNVEVWGLTITEALACGTPVIATAVGGIPEQIVDGETGFLVPRGDSQAMTQRIIGLMNRPDLCRQMGQAAAAYAQQAYSLDRQTMAYLQWFEDLRAEYDKMAKDAFATRG
jgi:glycosyltransferase involved in cell wall biosynthesis